ncbi:MAG: hypothetical protein ACO3Z6_12270 [Pseudomonadales bacterium]
MFQRSNQRGAGVKGSFGSCLSALLITLVGSASHAVEPSVNVVSLQVSRPAVEGGYELPGTRLILDVVLPGREVLGLGTGSAITRVQDDRGNDLIADGKAREKAAAQVAQSLANETGGVLTERAPSGNIDRETALNQRDPERGSIQVPVVSLGLAGRDASSLRINGELEIEVAGAGERVIRLSGVDLSDTWPSDIRIGDQTAQCSRDAYLQIDGMEVSEFYCWGSTIAIKRIEVVGQPESPMPIEGSRTNLQVVGAITGLTLDVVVPEVEKVVVPIDLAVGIGL